ncbi:MAG: LacI family DNA-binding transcriptional regulator [Microvirga sp.]
MSYVPKRPARTAPSRSRLQDIAEACDVSISTVSRALAGQKGVRSDVRQRILEAARAARYPVPGRLQGARIAILASTAAMTDYGRSQFTWHVLEGLKAAALSHAIEFSLVALPDTDADPDAPLAGLDDDETSGIVLLTVDDRRVLERVGASGKPAILINGEDPLMRISSVSPCNRSAARMACRFLIELGHERIGFMMRPGRPTIRRRLEGWQDSLAEAGLAARPEDVISVGDWTPECAELAMVERIGRGGLGFTALLCAADSLAMGALSALKAHGIPCPDDVSVMGIDNLPVSELLTPRLTTMHIPARDLGETAVEMLMDQIRHGPRLPRRTELACRLIARESTAAIGSEARERKPRRALA